MFSFRSVIAFSAVLSFITQALCLTTVKINALGDSITGSPGCWRALLWQQLQAAGVTNTDFVGTLPAQGCGFTYDGENDGHGGYLATGIVTDNDLPGWLAISQPDIVMMELGTNDVWNSIPSATIITAFSTLVDQMRAQKATMRILVAQITPMNPSGCTTCAQGVVDLNAAIVAWAPGKSTAASPITVVDCWTGYNTTTDTGDGVHPNDSGNVKLANCWYEPLKAAIIIAGGGSATSSTVPTTLKTTSTTKSSITTTKASTTTSKASSTSTKTSATSTTTSSLGTVPLYGQCGGQGYTGSTVCASGTCTYSNAWYSQCLA